MKIFGFRAPYENNPRVEDRKVKKSTEWYEQWREFMYDLIHSEVDYSPDSLTGKATLINVKGTDKTGIAETKQGIKVTTAPEEAIVFHAEDLFMDRWRENQSKQAVQATSKPDIIEHVIVQDTKTEQIEIVEPELPAS